MSDLTHLDEKGAAHMVDIGDKDVTTRRAVAEGFIKMHPDTLALIYAGGLAKGDVLAAARIAGIMAAKKNQRINPALSSAACHHSKSRF